ncbi:MAG: EamA family transporter [Dehalococcoidia bacterium]|nr:EamA family transporter [Dehalococcoidia bacterium]
MTPRQTVVLLALGLMWGSSFLYVRVLLDEIETPLIVAARTLIATVFLFGLVWAWRLPLPKTRATYGWIVFMGSVGAAIPFLLITWSVNHIPTGTASVLNSTMPLFVAGLSVFMLDDERFTPSRLFGVIAGFLGVGVLSGVDAIEFNRDALLGNAAMLAAAFSYGASAIAARLHLRGEHGVSLGALQMLCAFILVAPLMLISEPPSALGRLGLEEWLAMAAISLGVSALAYLAYYWLIENAGAVKTSMVGYLLPAVGVVLGWLVLNEDVGWNTLGGLALIAIGIAFVNGMLSVPGTRSTPDREASPPGPADATAPSPPGEARTDESASVGNPPL